MSFTIIRCITIGKFSLFCHLLNFISSYNTSLMVKFDLETGDYLHEQLPNALFGNQAPYQPSAFTDFDFAIDEEGLWVIYSTVENTLDIVVSKIDPNTLDVLATFKTNWRKKWAGNAFMACGVLYVLKKVSFTCFRLLIQDKFSSMRKNTRR